MNQNKHVTILGAGPAGLMAALAATQKGYDVEIIADGEPSVVGGAQYLHQHVPGLTDDWQPTMLTYVKVGDINGYAAKAYGEKGAQVSWDTFVTGEYPSWNLKRAYEKLWDASQHLIKPHHIEPGDIDQICLDQNPVFSSIPLNVICKDAIAHEFKGQRVLFTEEDYVKVPEMIVYNGRITDDWYRAACLFGYSSTEYALHGDDHPSDVVDPRQVIFDGIKPVSNQCNCYSIYSNFHKIGRFGQWRRGVLTNHAFEEVESAL